MLKDKQSRYSHVSNNRTVGAGLFVMQIFQFIELS